MNERMNERTLGYRQLLQYGHMSVTWGCYCSTVTPPMPSPVSSNRSMTAWWINKYMGPLPCEETWALPECRRHSFPSSISSFLRSCSLRWAQPCGLVIWSRWAAAPGHRGVEMPSRKLLSGRQRSQPPVQLVWGSICKSLQQEDSCCLNNTYCASPCQILMKAKSGEYEHLHFPVRKPRHTRQVTCLWSCSWQWWEQSFPGSVWLQSVLPLELKDYSEAILTYQPSQCMFSVFYLL